MKTEKLTSVDAFVVFDLDAASTSLGIVRLAPKVLVDGATWLARSQTYQFASFELAMGGASAGINARPDGRAAAVEGFVAEVAPWVASHRLLVDAGKGVSEADLSPLRGDDPRGAAVADRAATDLAVGLTQSIDSAVGALDSCRVAIEGADVRTIALVDQLAARGASVVAVSTSAGTAEATGGLSPESLKTELTAHGADAVAHLGVEVGPADALFATDADVLVVGSKAGVLDHHVAATVTAAHVVPSGPIPVTAKALAVLGRRGSVVLPDFITTAGPTLTSFPSVVADGDRYGAVSARIAAALAEVIGTEEPPVLVACRRAEAYLATWCDDLPFGRPLA